MQWLPAIRKGQGHWVLPLSLKSADALAACLQLDAARSVRSGALFEADSENRSAEQLASQRAERLLPAFSGDPALVLFALLELSNDESASHPSSERTPELSWWELADWLSLKLDAIFLDADRLLRTQQLAAASEISAVDPRWEELRGVALQQPPSELMQSVGAWLLPHVPGAEQDSVKSWPELAESQWSWSQDLEISDVSDNAQSHASEQTSWQAPIGYGQSQVDLNALAEFNARCRSLEQSFGSVLRESKLEALKELAYGLSHEINNPLAGIRTRVEHLMADEVDASRRSKCARVVDSVMRAHEMIADLMYFAHPPVPEKESVQVDCLIQSIVSEYQIRFTEFGIKIRCIRAGQGITVAADLSQIRDALRALLDNACEAVGVDGEVAVDVYVHEDNLVFCISDSGPGLSDKARKHAFDPYFSGREAGRGLGLGLNRVYRVAVAHGGGAELESVPVGCRAKMWIRIA